MPTSSTAAPRPPVVAIMGHIDHGKSSLLDYIRKTNVVGGEAGGITQHLSAYEVTHASAGAERSITFLDTPGHEAFQKMRERGVGVADIAVLVVSAEDGVKPQTLEAYRAAEAAKVPLVVALTKIDKPNANVERAKASLLEHGIYLEGLGGSIPSVPVSSKTGSGIAELLDMILLVADVAGLSADPSLPPTGTIIEAHVDPRKGVSATLIVKDGVLHAGSFVVAGDAYAPTRIMQNFLGEPIREAGVSKPVRIVGWSKLPQIGSAFAVAKTKREAEITSKEAAAPQVLPGAPAEEEDRKPVIPVVIKADAAGSIDAIEHELKKIRSDRVEIKVLATGVGAIAEGDVKRASAGRNALIVGFNIKADAPAAELAERLGIAIATFDVIYKLAEWLKTAIAERTPKVETEEVRGSAKILKTFSRAKNKQIVGGRLESGVIAVGDTCAILRRGERLATGKIVGLEQQKASAKRVENGEFGAEIDTKLEIAPGDVVASFSVVIQ